MRAALAWAVGMSVALLAMFAYVHSGRLDGDRVFNPPPASSMLPALSCSRTAGAVSCQEVP